MLDLQFHGIILKCNFVKLLVPNLCPFLTRLALKCHEYIDFELMRQEHVQFCRRMF